MEFKTVSGHLAACHASGFAIQLTDDRSRTYFIGSGKSPENLKRFLGERVEIKGLVESEETPNPQLHPLMVMAVD